MGKTNYMLPDKKPEIEINKTTKTKFWQRPDFNLMLYVLMMLVSYYLWQDYNAERRAEIPYSEFLQHVEKKEIKEAVITEKYIAGTLTTDDPITQRPQEFITIPLADTRLATMLESHDVTYTVRHSSNWLGNFIANWVLPLGLLFLFWGWMAKRMGNLGRGFLNLGNRVHIHPESLPKVTFDDVAGAEEAKLELKEGVDFLKDPSRIQRLGGHMPKGLLLVGAPGTGKTLLARAMAGEAGVPFFNISGSEFIEMFVGVGAARVREMFEQAREKAPCIIFIDELDAIGRARSAGPVLGGHDEREQTLNQLLTEMDGFDPSIGVVVMGATNRPEILDKALLRAGRFDRQIVVDKPDFNDRLAILKLHCRNIKMAEDMDLKVIARRTSGMVGADLANIVNEAAIRGVRENHDKVTPKDFEDAIDRILAGPEKRSRALSDAEKRRVAYHEAGHAIVAATVPNGVPVHKVSIIPHGVGALGFTLQLPVEEKFLTTRNEFRDQIAVLMGGRVAEEIAFRDISSGAENDLQRASEIARAMVTQLGMSEQLGPSNWGRRESLQFLGVYGSEERNFSEATAQLIDAEVKAFVDEGHQRATQILTDMHAALATLADMLIKNEVVSGDEVRRILQPTS